MKKQLSFLFIFTIMTVGAQENVHQEFMKKSQEIEKKINYLRDLKFKHNEGQIDGSLRNQAWWLDAYSYLDVYIDRYFNTSPDKKMYAKAYFLRAVLIGDRSMYPGEAVLYLVNPFTFPLGVTLRDDRREEVAMKDLEIYLKYNPDDKNALAFRYYLEDTTRRSYQP